jgi:hypothetical protein
VIVADSTLTHDQNSQPPQVLSVSIDAIRPADVNGEIYKPVDPADPEIHRLADTIRDHGILHPLVITTDCVILSGHRRYCAAQVAGLVSVPVMFAPVASDDPQFVKLLVAANTARDKTLAEVIRETVVFDATPEQAYGQLLVDRHRRSCKATDGAANKIRIGERKDRPKIGKGRRPFLDAVIAVLESLRDYWPLSDRTVHYQLLNDPPYRWTKTSKRSKKPSERYANDDKSYTDLTRLLTQARFEGYIPFEAIHDPTRPVTEWNVFATAGQYVRSSVEDFLRYYSRDLLQSQPNHIEVIGEKNTLASIIRPVCSEYTVPLTIGRGYCSVPPRKAMFDRYIASGKEALVIVVLSDHDPDGEVIAESVARSMRDDFKIPHRQITAVRAALTHEQVHTLALPPNNERAKEKSSNYQKFVRKFGDRVHELEALAPPVLQQLLRDAIQSVLDRDAFDEELRREKHDAHEIAAARAAAVAALGDHNN